MASLTLRTVQPLRRRQPLLVRQLQPARRARPQEPPHRRPALRLAVRVMPMVTVIAFQRHDVDHSRSSDEKLTHAVPTFCITLDLQTTTHHHRRHQHNCPCGAWLCHDTGAGADGALGAHFTLP